MNKQQKRRDRLCISWLKIINFLTVTNEPLDKFFFLLPISLVNFFFISNKLYMLKITYGWKLMCITKSTEKITTIASEWERETRAHLNSCCIAAYLFISFDNSTAASLVTEKYIDRDILQNQVKILAVGQKRLWAFVG
jgi:hypothetical protein